MTRKQKIHLINAFRRGEELEISRFRLSDAVFSIIMKHIRYKRDPAKYPAVTEEDREVLKREGFEGLLKTYIDHD